MSKMKETFYIIFHATACVLFAFGVYYDYAHVIIPKEAGRTHGAYGGKFKFLTFWDAVSIKLKKKYSFTCLSTL